MTRDVMSCPAVHLTKQARRAFHDAFLCERTAPASSALCPPPGCTAPHSNTVTPTCRYWQPCTGYSQTAHHTGKACKLLQELGRHPWLQAHSSHSRRGCLCGKAEAACTASWCPRSRVMHQRANVRELPVWPQTGPAVSARPAFCSPTCKVVALRLLPPKLHNPLPSEPHMRRV